MRCVICKHGETQPGLVTVTLERDESIVIIKRVPAEVCDNCGEYYLSDIVFSNETGKSVIVFKTRKIEQLVIC